MRAKIPYLLSALLGLGFIFSSLTKLIGICSFARTLEEFFPLLGMDCLQGFGLLMAVLICLGEFCLGLLALHPRMTRIMAWVFPIVMGIFTWITWQNMTALYQVESCGCFGEVIHLTPAESFWKNVILLALSIGLAISVLVNLKYNPLNHRKEVIGKEKE